MPRYTSALITLALCAGALCVSPSLAQLAPGEAGGAGIVGTGSVTIDREPNLCRLQLLISTDGKDVKEALGKLKEQEAAIKEKLQKLGASDGSVSFSDPQTQDANQRQQMDRMIQARMGRSAAKPNKNQPAVVTVSTTLKAEWALSAKGGDELLIESQELQGRIKSADLAGGKTDKAATAEQEEAAEEAQAFNTGDGQVNPHDPIFVYVSKISDEDREKARAGAFKKAHDDAERLARAAGAQLGQILLLGSNAAPTTVNDRYSEMYYGAFQQQQAMMGRMGSEADDTAEAVGTQPGKVGYRMTVYASFAIKGP
jgi:uncharacterized protein YggE